MVQAAEMELQNKKLELDENEQIIDMLKAGASDNIKREKTSLDNETKKDLKIMEIENAKEKLMKDLIEQSNRDEKDLDMKGLEALVKLAINQSKKEGE
jgi:hypothetical protein